LYRPLVLADFGLGVLDAMVEIAAYVVRSLTVEEDKELTLQIVKDLPQVPTDKNNLFSTKKYEVTRELKRHQANGELRRLYDAGFITPVEGSFPRWSPLNREIERAPAPSVTAYPPLVCLRLLGEDDKAQALEETLRHADDPRRFVVSPEGFQQVPHAPFCYWVSGKIRRLFVNLPPFENNRRTVKQGLSTADDFRFVRTWWEVPVNLLFPPEAIPEEHHGAYCIAGKYRWAPLAKGGSFSPYYSDVHLVLNWLRDGEEIKAFPKSVIRNSDFYFRPGVTWTLRTQLPFNIKVFPKGGCVQQQGLCRIR
jgi:hypothetical protein